MTAQAADKMIFNGEEHRLFTNPLESLWEQKGFEKPDFRWRSTGNWRGYIATWDIIDDVLYLKRLDEDFPEPRSMVDFFPTSLGQPIKAWWYSGKLRIPQGELVYYVHGGYVEKPVKMTTKNRSKLTSPADFV